MCGQDIDKGVYGMTRVYTYVYSKALPHPIIGVVKSEMFFGWGNDPSEYKMEDTIMKVYVIAYIIIGSS
ncbi:hypothetical protein J1N35_041580 [Gossypium stocksii]|uniref:Uncharacterized protein n=1 Tax=Gossypium stocksii TaxID=47602 RepID=A0A9D3ZJE8_9ROSI|nr:hypothetical protein J1N35_041580 [Gossypium stocksii]